MTVELTLRDEEAVTVPSTAVQVSQTGNYVFVVENGAAKVQPVTVARVSESDAVICERPRGRRNRRHRRPTAAVQRHPGQSARNRRRGRSA